MLHGAIVCKVISNGNYYERSTIERSEQDQTAIKAICTYFGMYYTDERMRKDWISWIEIMREVVREGLGAAIKKHQSITPEGDRVKLSRKHIKKMEREVLQKAQDVVTYMPLFDHLFTEL